MATNLQRVLSGQAPRSNQPHKCHNKAPSELRAQAKQRASIKSKASSCRLGCASARSPPLSHLPRVRRRHGGEALRVVGRLPQLDLAKVHVVDGEHLRVERCGAPGAKGEGVSGAGRGSSKAASCGRSGQAARWPASTSHSACLPCTRGRPPTHTHHVGLPQPKLVVVLPVGARHLRAGPVVAVQDVGLAPRAQQELQGGLGEEVKALAVVLPRVHGAREHAVAGLDEEAAQPAGGGEGWGRSGWGTRVGASASRQRCSRAPPRRRQGERCAVLSPCTQPASVLSAGSPLHNAGGHKDLGAAPVKLRLVLQGGDRQGWAACERRLAAQCLVWPDSTWQAWQRTPGGRAARCSGTARVRWRLGPHLSASKQRRLLEEVVPARRGGGGGSAAAAW